MKKNYSKKQKIKIIELYSSGNTVTELSNQYGIAHVALFIPG